MIVNWTLGSQFDLKSIEEYITEDNPAAAKRVVLSIVNFAEKQLVMPRIGRPGRVLGTHELVMPKLPFTIAYRLVENRIDILRVIHHARLWPDML